MKNKRKNSIFYRLVLRVVLGCFLTALLSAIIYYFVGIRTLGKQISDEMKPRAHEIARLSSRYLDGKIGYDSFVFYLTSSQSTESTVYIFDNQGNILASSFSFPRITDFDIRRSIHFDYLNYVSKVLTTKTIITETDYSRAGCILVAVPIEDNLNRVNGVVIVTKPAAQLRRSMFSMILSLLSGSIIVAIILSFLTSMLGKMISDPIQNMTEISKQMARGDFTQQIDESLPGEIGELGKSLNDLSAELSNSIKELLASRNQLELILKGLGEGIAAVELSDCSVTYTNPACVKLLDENKLSFSEDPFKTRFFACARSALNQGGEAFFKQENGDSILQFDFTVVENNPPYSVKVVSLIRDITEAEKLEKTRREYVANVSHELKTPVASIRSLAETLNDGMLKNEEDKNRYYGHILRESMRLTRLINDLLELSRLQSGTVSISTFDFSLSELIGAVTERMAINAEYSGLTLYCTIPEALFVHSNKDRIEQVLVSLIDNAIKYASDDGIIEISAEREAEKVVVVVRNTGEVDETDIPHLFERFYKADKSHAGMGTGLGLAITKEILNQLGEQISVRNIDGFVEFAFTVSI